MKKKTVSVYMPSEPTKKKSYLPTALFITIIIVASAIGLWIGINFTSPRAQSLVQLEIF